MRKNIVALFIVSISLFSCDSIFSSAQEPVIYVTHDSYIISQNDIIDLGKTISYDSIENIYTVSNIGIKPLKLISISIDDRSNFYKLDTSGLQEKLEFGESTTFTISFCPKDNLGYPASVQIFSNDGSNSTFNFQVSGKSFYPVASGNENSIVVNSNGNVFIVGSNNHGKLGINQDFTDFSRIFIPIQVHGADNSGLLSNINIVSQKVEHILALDAAGKVYAWGDNQYGQLGDDSSGMDNISLFPKLVKGPNGDNTILSEITAISTGYSFSLALKSDGTLYAWGSNEMGQLGDGTEGDNNITTLPTLVKGPEGGDSVLTDIISIAAGNNHVLALKNDGTVFAWGKNNVGQIGDGTSGQDISGWVLKRVIPVQVKSAEDSYLTDVISIKAGDDFSLALKADGTVYTWGSNSNGQCGDGTSGTERLFPVQVKNSDGTGFLQNIRSISAGNQHCLALTEDDTVFSWGLNNAGQLGDSTSGTNRLYPVQVLGINGTGTMLNAITGIAAGNYISTAINNQGDVYSWGSNSSGQLAVGTSGFENNKSIPVLTYFLF